MPLARVLVLLVATQSPWLTSHVDTIERNHVYDWRGEHKLSQVIFWRGERVVAWCQSDDAGTPRRVGGQWRMDVRTQGKWYRVQAPAYRETWTQWDPEVIDRGNRFPQDREGL